MTAGMSEALKKWAAVERGRAAQLAEKLEVSRAHISEIVNGHKVPSSKLLRRIAEATGLPLSDLMGTQEQRGMAEPGVEAFAPAPQQAASLRQVMRTLFPHARNPEYVRAVGDHAAFGISDGDLVAYSQQFDAAAASPDDLVIVRKTDASGFSHTTIGRLARPWIIGHDARMLGAEGKDAAVIGLVCGILRGTIFTSSAA